MLGIWGLMGAGRTELLRPIYGLDKADSGMVLLTAVMEKGAGARVVAKETRELFGYVTEARHDDGCLLSHGRSGRTLQRQTCILIKKRHVPGLYKAAPGQ